MYSFSELLEFYVNTRFVTDCRGDLVPLSGPRQKHKPPLVFVAWNEFEYVYRFRNDVQAEKRQKVERHLGQLQSLAGVKQLPCAEHIEAILSTESSGSGHVYLGLNAIRPQGDAIRVERENAEVLRAHFESAIDRIEELQPCFAILDQYDAVSVCDTVRRSAQAEEAAVYTIETHRRRQFAVAVTSAWASEVRAKGRIPIYSASQENTASQDVAERVGLVQCAIRYSAG